MAARGPANRRGAAAAGAATPTRSGAGADRRAPARTRGQAGDRALQGGALVPPTLNQDIEDLALVIDGAPKIHPLAGNAHDHLVQVPSAAWSRPPLPQPAGDHRSELQHPAAV